MFTLNETQMGLLAATHAWQDEGEQRFEFWSRREAQAGRSGGVRRGAGRKRTAGGASAERRSS